MVITEYYINWSSLNNITPPDLNISNNTIQELLNKVPETANTITNGYYGIVVLLMMLIFLYWVLTEKTQYSYFKYSEIRGLGISLGIVNVFGIVMLSIGYIVNIIHVSMLFTFFVMALTYTIVKNPS
jgi:hypothetical protein